LRQNNGDFLPAAQQRGNNFQGFTDFHLKAKASIWP